MEAAPAVRTVIDAHQHHGVLAHSPAAADREEGHEAAGWLAIEIAARRESMARLGITRTVMLPGHSYLRPDGLADTRRVNDEVAAYCARDPDTFLGAVGVVEPLYGAAGLPEIRRIHTAGMVGVSYHARFQGVPTNDIWILRQLAVLAESDMVPFVHSYADSTLEAPLLVGDLARAHPELTIVVLDGLSTYHHTLECISLAERYPNLVFDSAMAFNASAILQFVAAAGAHRMLFGSDIYSHPVRFTTNNTPAALSASGLGDVELDQILGGNLMRILGH